MGKYDKKYYLRQTQRGWIRKQSLIEMKGGGCEKCGYNKCSRCLSFHHRNPKIKKFTLDLRQIGNRTWKIVLEEFNKCDLLCMNCHGEHHDGETNKEYINYEKKLREAQICLCLNCGKEFKMPSSAIEKGEGKYCSADCYAIRRRVVDRPSKEQLEKLVWEKPVTKIALDYGVSDKAIEKWCKKYEIKKPARGYWSRVYKRDWC